MRSSAVALLIVTLLAIQLTLTSAAAQVNQTSLLSVRGRWIVDETGKPILLRGLNYPGYSYTNSPDGPQVHGGWTYYDFAQMGFNVVRLQISWANLEPQLGVYDPTYIDWYVDHDIRWAKNYGVYIVLDMQQDRWAGRFGGDGAPDWTVQQYPPTDAGMRQAVSNFWTNSTLQDHFITAWTTIASRYAKDATIAGYDILNEPWVYTSVNKNLNGTYVDAFYNKVINAIRAVDPSHIIFLEPSNMFTGTILPGSNIVWSPHFYPLSFYPTYSPDEATVLEADIAAKYKQFVLGMNSPMWIGEFGAWMKDGTELNWLEEAVSLFDEYNVGWAWCCYESGAVPAAITHPYTTVALAVNSYLRILRPSAHILCFLTTA